MTSLVEFGILCFVISGMTLSKKADIRIKVPARVKTTGDSFNIFISASKIPVIAPSLAAPLQIPLQVILKVKLILVNQIFWGVILQGDSVKIEKLYKAIARIGSVRIQRLIPQMIAKEGTFCFMKFNF